MRIIKIVRRQKQTVCFIFPFPPPPLPFPLAQPPTQPDRSLNVAISPCRLRQAT